MKKWLIFAAVVGLSTSVFATVPPAPIWHEVELSDGSVTQVRLQGNANFHWYEDQQGSALIEQQGSWFFAEIKHDGVAPYLVSTGEEKSAASIAPSSAQDRLASQVVQAKDQITSLPLIERSRSLPRSQLASRSALFSAAQPFKQPLLVVQVSFRDTKMQHDFTDLVFSEVNQSVVDYYDKNSFGQYRVVPAQETFGTVNDGVIDVLVSQRHPNCHNSSLCTSRLNAVFSEAYREVNKYIDFAPYDLNRDSTIDPSELSVMFVFAGGDRSTGVLTKPAIWPHMFSHDPVSVDGKQISAYCLFADYQVNHQSTLGVIVHELGHLMLGLPDLYSYKHSGSVGSWGLMGGGSWAMKEGDANAGDTPVNMSAWSRHAAGFIDPKILKSSDSHVVVANQQAAIVSLDPYLQEFGPRLYVENRRKVDYDRALEAEGVLVTSVNINNTFNDMGPMQVQIMQADGLGELETGRWSDGADVYPGESQNNHISDNSQPSLTSVTGFETGVSLDNITSSPDSASFSFRRPVEGYEFAWMTSFRRDYVVSEAEKNSAAFAVTLDTDSMLEGIQLYYQSLTLTKSVDYVVASYPASHAHFSALVLDPRKRTVLAQGRHFGNGRILFDTPAKLPAGSYTLVVEVQNAQLEQNYVFSELQNMQPADNKTIWLGNSKTSSSDGMTKLFPYQVIPFAALFDKDISELLAPVDDSLNVDKNGTLLLSLTDNDQIAASLEESVSVEVISQPRHGTLKDMTYTAKENFVGSDQLSYRLRTADGRMVSSVANVTIFVIGANTAPQTHAVVQSLSLLPGQRVVLDGAATQDPDGDRLSYQWRQTLGPNVNLIGAQTESAQFTLPDTVRMGDVLMFSLRATDPSGLSHSAHVQLVVENSSPIARDDFVTIESGASIEILPLRNDSDHDEQRLQVVSVSNPTLDNVQLIDNQIRYQAPESVEQITDVVLDYTISDTEGKTAQARVTINITPAPVTVQTLSSNASGGGSSGGSVSVMYLLALLLIFTRRRWLR